MPITVTILGGGARSASAFRRITLDAPRVVVGRGEGCDVRLPDATVSHRHFSIRQRGSEFFVVDEGSTNGTRVGKTRLAPHAGQPVGARAIVRAGRVVVELAPCHDPPTAQAPAFAKQMAMDLVVDALASEGEDARPRLTVETGPDAGARLALDHGVPAILGRSKGASLELSDGAASRKHVEIVWKGDALWVRDLGSKTGTELGGRAVGARPVPWRAGETLRIGETEVSYAFEGPDALAEIERAPDEKVSVYDLEPPPDPDAGDEAAKADAAGEAESGDSAEPTDAGGEPEPDALSPAPAPRAARGGGWSITDVAVVLLAVGVFSLSAVGYLVLLR